MINSSLISVKATELPFAKERSHLIDAAGTPPHKTSIRDAKGGVMGIEGVDDLGEIGE